MATLHLISHTHWDREWYLTFQQFRLKLIRLIDDLLDLLAVDSNGNTSFKCFMLDGQTIVLDDYLQIRPERETELRDCVQSGRLLIGPWHILPDEFLVSPEATIRNLLQGGRSARRLGPKMQIGYLPDPFGHISQMPQILTGFGFQAACLRRGLDDHPCEMWWRAPDGSTILLAYLRDGYDNAAALPVADPEAFVTEAQKLRDSLLPHCATTHILLMQGTDHMRPQPATSAAVAYANQHPDGDGDTLVHSSLPAYLTAVQAEIAAAGQHRSLPVITGELRSSKRHHLLPGVLSTRSWIKHRNHVCEMLLEKWAEPFSALAAILAPPPLTFRNPENILRRAWRQLMECHPHDSICGCSIDQVHDEMRSRFDQVEQIGEELTRQSLEAIAAQIDTRPPAPQPDSLLPIVVFNPTGVSRSDAVLVTLPMQEGDDHFEIVDQAGQILPYQVESTTRRNIARLDLNRQGLFSLLGGVSDGTVTGLPSAGMVIQEISLQRKADILHILATLADFGQPNREALARVAPEIASALADEKLERFIVQAESVSSQVRFQALCVPAYGYKTFWLRRRSPQSQAILPPIETKPSAASTISNEFFRLEFTVNDGTFTLTDLRSNFIYPGLNRFVDGGDRGDTYNYCPPEKDLLVTSQVRSIQVETNPLKKSIRVEFELPIPIELAPDRQSRSNKTISMQVITTASLTPGLPRLEFHTEVHNLAKDHRLRVHFPAPFASSHADYDGHFEIVRRSIGVPDYDGAWVEAPRPEVPQRAFTAISTEDRLIDQGGLLIANRGLPEVEVFTNDQGNAEIALTLLRCVGWLSRDDLHNRQGHAGPELTTPGAQMPGYWGFDYAMVPYTPENTLEAYHQAYAFNAPLRAITTDIHHGELPACTSFFQFEPLSFIASAIKIAEDGDGLILRGYNIAKQQIQVKVKPRIQFKEAIQTNLAEEEHSSVLLMNADSNIEFTLGKHQIATIRFRLPGLDK